MMDMVPNQIKILIGIGKTSGIQSILNCDIFIYLQ